MSPKQLLKNAVPTPFGWVFTSPESDLTGIVSFRDQLLALSRACNVGGSVAPGVQEQAAMPTVLATVELTT
jgi:hypothetical protein